ncbi:hypothetical protein LTR86_002493 [Recurvomyces mirabilis]|nr:hypothetical protein LTR86_002493 [Recurvomyces mirabilis]
MAVSAGGGFVIALVIIILLVGGGYILYAHWRARRLGLPPPTLNPFAKRSQSQANASYRAPAPAPGGIQGWFAEKWASLRNTRTAGGAYEGTNYGGAGSARDRRGFGPLDPDEAWDARVDHEAGGYYEEQELGLQDPSHGPYGGGGYGEVGVGGIPDDRGRSRSRQREVDKRYDEEMHGGAPSQPAGGNSHLNPFGDQNEATSLRNVSPRPHLDTGAGPTRGVSSHKKNNNSLGTSGSAENSPTERRSMFHEDV